MNLFDRSIPVPESGCWLWLFSTDRQGYGQMRHGVRTIRAHRHAFEQANGSIPPGLCVLHRCDTPLCINPDHLFLGTQAENMRDCLAKGRRADQRKTHCPLGHEYSSENSYVRPTGRGCRKCRAIASAKYRGSL